MCVMGWVTPSGVGGTPGPPDPEVRDVSRAFVSGSVVRKVGLFL